jgi:hypothetical protein
MKKAPANKAVPSNDGQDHVTYGAQSKAMLERRAACR